MRNLLPVEPAALYTGSAPDGLHLWPQALEEPWKRRSRPTAWGKFDVQSDRYWGAQTQRSLQNFKIGGHRFSRGVIQAFGTVKKAAALTNLELGKLDQTKTDLIARACDEVISGQLDDHFPLVVWQTGSGTQSNMNANEVISNRAIELAGGVIGSKSPDPPQRRRQQVAVVQRRLPDGDARRGGACRSRSELLPAIAQLSATFWAKSKEFADIVKIGRTHLMDATPLTLGQEFSGYASQLDFARERIASRDADALRARARRERRRHGAQHSPEVRREGRCADCGAHRAAVPHGAQQVRRARRPRRDRPHPRRPQDARRRVHEDRQRHPPARERPALRHRRDRPSRRTSPAARSCPAR